MGTLDPEEMAMLAKPGSHDKLLFLGLGQWDVQRVKSQELLRGPEIWSDVMSPTDQEAASKDQEGHLGHLSSEVSKGLVPWERFLGLRACETPTGRCVKGSFCPQPRSSSVQILRLPSSAQKSSLSAPFLGTLLPSAAASASSRHPRLTWTSPCSCCWESCLSCSSKEWVRACGGWAGGDDVEVGWQQHLDGDLTSLGGDKSRMRLWDDLTSKDLRSLSAVPIPTATRERVQVPFQGLRVGSVPPWGQTGAGGSSQWEVLWLAGMTLRGRANGCSRLPIKTQPRGNDLPGTGP